MTQNGIDYSVISQGINKLLFLSIFLYWYYKVLIDISGFLLSLPKMLSS